jgi:SAM-dependent methyltransferase
MQTAHDAQILDQFTKQAAPFAERHRRDDDLIRLLVETSGVEPGDRVLDVACGPGIVACALAEHAGHVTGVDFTPAMLEQAAALQRAQNLSNVDWREGSATRLPFPDASFDCVVTRFSFHHYVDPDASFREMVRLCRPGGTILVADVAPRPEACAAYDAMEKQRDPSHTRALAEDEFVALGRAAGLTLRDKRRHDLATDVDGLLSSSFPPAGGAESFRSMIEADLASGRDTLGIQARRAGTEIMFHFPVLVLAWEKRAEPGA